MCTTCFLVVFKAVSQDNDLGLLVKGGRRGWWNRINRWKLPSLWEEEQSMPQPESEITSIAVWLFPLNAHAGVGPDDFDWSETLEELQLTICDFSPLFTTQFKREGIWQGIAASSAKIENPFTSCYTKRNLYSCQDSAHSTKLLQFISTRVWGKVCSCQPLCLPGLLLVAGMHRLWAHRALEGSLVLRSRLVVKIHFSGTRMMLLAIDAVPAKTLHPSPEDSFLLLGVSVVSCLNPGNWLCTWQDFPCWGKEQNY